MPFSTLLAAGLVSLAAAGPALSPGQLKKCAAGMDGKLPSDPPPDFQFSGNVRKYYVAADELEWDYAPSGWDNWLGVPLNDSTRAKMAGYLTYGTKWTKALYRGYTDATFKHLSPQPSYQGIQGPTLRAEVGDMIEIMFVNNLEQNYASMHSMGLAYSKTSEGADYPNNTMPGTNVVLPPSEAVPPVDGGMPPGECVVYKWLANDLAGPNNGEPARAHSYHSYVSMNEDTNAGLIGPGVIYAPGAMASTTSQYREFPLIYMIYDEATSFLSATNSAKIAGKKTATPVPNIYPGGNHSVWYPQEVNLNSANKFSGAPSFHTMNGGVFSNTFFPMCEGDDVIWYVNGYGAASHVFHMHGSSFTYWGEKAYSVSLNDGVGHALYMNATAVGKWQVLCHVNDHQAAGMVSDYQIYPAGKCPLPPPSKTNYGL